ncbi:MAG: hypothetical protein ACTSYI_06070 [Promethearchaeota archaeon]
MPDIYSMLFFGKKCDLPTLIRKVPEVHSAFLKTSQTPEDPIEILALTWMGATPDSQQYIHISPFLPLSRQSNHPRRSSLLVATPKNSPIFFPVESGPTGILFT